jgi:hypothetical protein
MNRTRISTTVDATQLARCRALLDAPDSQLLDRAIHALVEQLTAEHELRALEAQPYEDDPELAFEPQTGPALPYEGQVPEDVQALAAARRGRR